MKNFLILIFLILVSCSYQESKKIIIERNSLIITAHIYPKKLPFRSDKVRVKGKIAISNLANISQPYGNEFLFMKIGTQDSSRTYNDIIASTAIDITLVEISSKDSLNLDVYWVFDEAVTLEKLSLQLDAEGIKNECDNMLSKPVFCN